MKHKFCVAILAAACAVLVAPVRAETPEDWIKLGARVHGGFGAFIPAGIRIGLDALDRLKVEPRGVTVTFYSGEKSPCPCIADGVMLATQASPGQGSLQVAAEKAPAGLLAVVVVRDKKSGAGAALRRQGRVARQDRRLEQGSRSRRPLSGRDVGAGTVRGRAGAIAHVREK
jgi:formylmethanofuran dehydrogenase subunit E